MRFIAHILNIVIKKFVFFQQFNNIIWNIWLLAKYVINTNQCLNFGYYFAVKTTQVIQYLLCFWFFLLFIVYNVCKIKCLLYKPQIYLVFHQYFNPIDFFYAQLLLPIYFKPPLLFYSMVWGYASAISWFDYFSNLLKIQSR